VEVRGVRRGHIKEGNSSCILIKPQTSRASKSDRGGGSGGGLRKEKWVFRNTSKF